MSEEPVFEELLKMTARAGDLVDEKAILTSRIAELEAFVRKLRDFYHDHGNITPPPCAPGADHSDKEHTWGIGSYFEKQSRKLLGL